MATTPTRTKNAPPPPVNGQDGEVVIDDGTTAVESAIEVADPNAAPAVEDEGVKSLKEQLDAERVRRENAERALSAERIERGKDQAVLTDSRLLVIDSTISANEAKKVDIQRRLKDAKEAGDYDAEVSAIDDLTMVNGDLKQAKLGKERLEQQIEEAKNAPRIDPNADQFDEWLSSQTNMGDASKTWLRSHRDWVEDPVKNAELTRAHHLALRGGAALNTTAYFTAIEKELGLADGTAPAARETEERRETPALTAPVSRSANGGDAGGRTSVPGIVQTGPNKYRTTNDAAGQAIRETAAFSGITVAEYIAEALKLQRGTDGQLH